MGRYVSFYVDVEEFSQYKDKWARASKWMKERFGVHRKTSYSWSKDEDKYLKVEMWERDDGVCVPNGWSRCYSASGDYSDRMIAAFPQEHRRVYYKADNILYGEM